MIVSYNALFGYVNIVFHLAFFMVLVKKSCEAVYEGCKNVLAFSVFAIPTRHEVSILLTG